METCQCLFFISSPRKPITSLPKTVLYKIKNNMTTYNGKSASFDNGKEVINKEPHMSKFVIEKLYRIHRERVLTVKPAVDTHVHVPEFMKCQKWKKLAGKRREELLAEQNHLLFQRISKVENSQSQLGKETEEHFKRVNHNALYLKKNKEENRIRSKVKIQKENEYVSKRIENAQPQLTGKEITDWYKPFEHFKDGRYFIFYKHIYSLVLVC